MDSDSDEVVEIPRPQSQPKAPQGPTVKTASHLYSPQDITLGLFAANISREEIPVVGNQEVDASQESCSSYDQEDNPWQQPRRQLRNRAPKQEDPMYYSSDSQPPPQSHDSLEQPLSLSRCLIPLQQCYVESLLIKSKVFRNATLTLLQEPKKGELWLLLKNFMSKEVIVEGILQHKGVKRMKQNSKCLEIGVYNRNTASSSKVSNEFIKIHVIFQAIPDCDTILHKYEGFLVNKSIKHETTH